MKAIKLLLFFFCVLPAYSQGKVITIENFKSEYIKPRNVEIWIPDEYQGDAGQKFPVLYMQDGQNVFNTETATNGISWNAAKTAQQLISEGKIEPMIIVAVWSSDLRFYEYFPEKAGEYLNDADKEQMDKPRLQAGKKKSDFLADEYLKFLAFELKPYVDKEYRTMPEAPYTSVCGSSMGGLISLYAVCEYPDIFGQAACVSTHWPILPNNENMNPSDAVRKYLELNMPTSGVHRFYFDYGTETIDQYYEVHQTMVNGIMEAKGYTQGQDFITIKYVGADHSEKSWQERFDGVLEYLYKK